MEAIFPTNMVILVHLPVIIRTLANQDSKPTNQKIIKLFLFFFQAVGGLPYFTCAYW